MFMAKTPGEIMLGAELPDALVAKFKRQAEEADSKKKRSLRAAVRLWVDLPLDVQVRLANKSQTDENFLDLFVRLLQERGDIFEGEVKDIVPTPEEACRVFSLLSADEKPAALEAMWSRYASGATDKQRARIHELVTETLKGEVGDYGHVALRAADKVDRRKARPKKAGGNRPKAG